MHERWTIGIDLGVTSKHAVVVVDTQTGETLVKRFSFPHTAAGMQRLLDRLERVRQHAPDAGFTAVMEPTGKMWVALAAVLREHGIESRLPSVAVAAAYRNKSKKAGKTNEIDADCLARLPLFDAKKLHPACLRNQPTGDLHSWCKFHERLSKRVGSLKNSIYAQFQLVSPKMLHGFGADPFMAAGRVFMRRYVNPHRVLNSGVKRLTKVFAKAPRIDEERAKELAQHVYACAQSVVEFYRPVVEGHGLPFSFDAIQAQVNLLLNQLEFHEQQLRTVEDHIAQLYTRVNPQASTQSLPGFGKHIAPVVDSGVGHIGRFKNGGAFAAYVRTVPRHKRTGAGRVPKGQHERQPLRKDGNRYLQKQFYLAAEVARHWDVDCAKCYLESKAKGLHHTQCVLAVAHDLALRYYALKRRQLNDPEARYEFRDEHGRPISKKEAKAIVDRLYDEAKSAEPGPGSAQAASAEPGAAAPPAPSRTGLPAALGEVLADAAAALGLDEGLLAQAVADLRVKAPRSSAEKTGQNRTKNA